MGPNRFAPRAGLATATEQRGPSHAGAHVGQEGHWQVWPGEATTGARARGGRRHAVHRFVTGVHERAREGSRFAQRREGSPVAAEHDLMVAGGTPAMSYGGGAVSA